MGQYNTLTAKKEWCGGFDDPRITAGMAPAPERKAGPISQELQELHDVIEQLERQHFTLSDRLRTAYPVDTVPSTKQADGVAMEPATGCELKDRIAHIKQQALYLTRLNNELTEKLWI